MDALLADANTMIGKISTFLLGVLFVGWGVWRLRQYMRHWYPREPKP